MRNLTEEQCRTLTLEAFADTFVPGEKRSPDDIAVAGAAAGPGAVEAGALELLETPATGVSDGLAELADSLNEHAAQYAVERGISIDRDLPPFAALGFKQRTEAHRDPRGARSPGEGVLDPHRAVLLHGF